MEQPTSIRKRMKRWEHEGDVRFITFSCHRRLPLLGDPNIRDLFADRLCETRKRFGLELFAWVVMPEHVHLLVRPTPDVPLHRVLLSLKLSIAQRVRDRWKALDAPELDRIRASDGSPRFWQKGGGFDRNVRDMREFRQHVHYIHNNPVKRGLLERPQDWKWSSVRWWMGEREDEIDCDFLRGGDWSTWKGFM